MLPCPSIPSASRWLRAEPPASHLPTPRATARAASALATRALAPPDPARGRPPAHAREAAAPAPCKRRPLWLPHAGPPGPRHASTHEPAERLPPSAHSGAAPPAAACLRLGHLPAPHGRLRAPRPPGAACSHAAGPHRASPRSTAPPAWAAASLCSPPTAAACAPARATRPANAHPREPHARVGPLARAPAPWRRLGHLQNVCTRASCFLCVPELRKGKNKQGERKMERGKGKTNWTELPVGTG
jgi:hypothetical protein